MTAGACWFAGCTRSGRTGKIARHPVTLCVRHAGAIEAALRQTDRFEVRWGDWGRAVIARRERRIGELRAAQDRLPEDDPDNWTWEPSERERIQWSIDRLEEEIRGIDPDGPPIITIRELSHYVAE